MRGAALPGMWTPAAAQPRALLALRPPRMGKGAVGPASAGPGSQLQAVGSVLMSGSPGAGVGMGTQVGAPALRSLPCSYIRDPSVGFRGGSPGPLSARRPLLPGSRCAGGVSASMGPAPPGETPFMFSLCLQLRWRAEGARGSELPPHAHVVPPRLECPSRPPPHGPAPAPGASGASCSPRTCLGAEGP